MAKVSLNQSFLDTVMRFTRTDVVTDDDLADDDVNDDPTKSISVATFPPPLTANALQSSVKLTYM